VELEDGTEIEAAAFVLATGKFLAGGLRRRSRLEETLFDLPVFYRGAEVGETDLLKLTAAKPWEPQKLFACGVRTDALLRPLGSEGKLLYENLFAAGSVLAGYDAEWEGSGLGVAIATGYAAGLGATGRL
jgi:glycerol-3-phosphate dehydrogenase subunit B